MKKTLLSASLVFLTAFGFAQKKLSEGIITYKVEWQPTPQMQQFAASLPSELTVYFKNDSASVLSKSPFASTVTILNSKTDFQRLLIDIPMRGKKYSVKFTPDDLETIKENGPEFALSPASETKKINGYTAQKYTITEKKSGKTSDAWFTKDVAITPNTLSQFFEQSNGFPLEFTSFFNQMPVKAAVKEVKEGTVPAGSFSAGKDYEEITFAQLMNLMGGGRR